MDFKLLITIPRDYSQAQVRTGTAALKILWPKKQPRANNGHKIAAGDKD